MDIIQESDLVIQIDDWKPALPKEIRKWLLENNIIYEEKIDGYGPASFHYNFYVCFENKEDMVAFKLRWT